MFRPSISFRSNPGRTRVVRDRLRWRQTICDLAHRRSLVLVSFCVAPRPEGGRQTDFSNLYAHLPSAALGPHRPDNVRSASCIYTLRDHLDRLWSRCEEFAPALTGQEDSIDRWGSPRNEPVPSASLSSGKTRSTVPRSAECQKACRRAALRSACRRIIRIQRACVYLIDGKWFLACTAHDYPEGMLSSASTPHPPEAHQLTFAAWSRKTWSESKESCRALNHEPAGHAWSERGIEAGRVAGFAKSWEDLSTSKQDDSNLCYCPKATLFWQHV
jgi:hypothetical protein